MSSQFRNLTWIALCVWTTGCNTQDILSKMKGDVQALCNWREVRFDSRIQEWVLHEYRSVPSRVRIAQSNLQFRISVSGQVPRDDDDSLMRDISLTTDLEGLDKMDVARSDETADDVLLSGTWTFENLCTRQNGNTQCDRVRWPGHMVYAVPKFGNSNRLKLATIEGQMDRDLDLKDDLAFRQYACRAR